MNESLCWLLAAIWHTSPQKSSLGLANTIINKVLLNDFTPHLMAGRVFSFRNSPHLSSVPTSQKWTGILFSFTIQ